MPTEADEIIVEHAEQLGCKIFRSVKTLPDVDLPLVGEYQRRNLALVTAVLNYLSREFEFDIDMVLEGVGKTRWPGRCQILTDDTVIDGAHNPEGAETLATTLEKLSPGQRYTVVFGCMADKDAASILRALAPVADEFVFVPIKGGRPCISPEELVKCVGHITSLPSFAMNSIPEALERQRKNPLLVTGSLYLTGEVLGLMAPETVLNI